MARRCELTGKGVLTGHNVSHSNIKTNRRFLPNVQQTTLHSEVLDRDFRLKVSVHAQRSVEHNGGLDGYLMKARPSQLSLRARRIKRDVAKALAGAAEAATA